MLLSVPCVVLFNRGEDDSVTQYIISVLEKNDRVEEALSRCKKGLPDLTSEGVQCVNQCCW